MLVRAKKSLGQNFLIDENILKEIVNLGNIDSKSQVIEIGPGTGNLTKEIVKKNPKDLILIEKDRFLIDKLNSLFSDKAKIINSDFLELKNHINFNNTIIFGNLLFSVFVPSIITHSILKFLFWDFILLRVLVNFKWSFLVRVIIEIWILLIMLA